MGWALAGGGGHAVGVGGCLGDGIEREGGGSGLVAEGATGLQDGGDVAAVGDWGWGLVGGGVFDRAADGLGFVDGGRLVVEQGGDRLYQVVAGDGWPAFAHFGPGVVDSATVGEAALWVEDEGLGDMGGFEQVAQLAGGVEQNGEGGFEFAVVVGGFFAGDVGIGDDGEQLDFLGMGVFFGCFFVIGFWGGIDELLVEAVEGGDVGIGDGALGGEEDENTDGARLGIGEVVGEGVLVEKCAICLKDWCFCIFG